MDMFYKNYARPNSLPDRKIIKHRINSMLKYAISNNVLISKVRLYFQKPYINGNEEVKRGLWILEFNRTQRTFEDLFSIYLFLKDVVKVIERQ